MEVRDQHHAPAALGLWKETSIFKIRDHVNPRGGFDTVEKKKLLLPPGVEPRFSRRSVCNPVTILAEARRFEYVIYMHVNFVRLESVQEQRTNKNILT
jgi:hypothetical protein